MKFILIYPILIFLFESHSHAQSIDSSTYTNLGLNVTIIGTSHNGNKKINDDSLFNILYKIIPDMVFEEIGPSGFHTPFYMELGHTLGIGRYSIEYSALKKLKETNIKFQIFPYDIEIKRRDNYANKLSRNDNTIRNLINKSYESKRLNFFEKKQIISYVTPKNYVTIRLNGSTLFDLNQKNVTDSTRKFYYLFKMEMLPLIDSNVVFNSIKEIAKSDTDFWETRNQQMAQKILESLKTTSGNKRIVILCGLHHKYYLEDLLKLQQEKYNFKLYDYWQLFKD